MRTIFSMRIPRIGGHFHEHPLVARPTMFQHVSTMTLLKGIERTCWYARIYDLDEEMCIHLLYNYNMCLYA